MELASYPIGESSPDLPQGWHKTESTTDLLEVTSGVGRAVEAPEPAEPATPTVQTSLLAGLYQRVPLLSEPASYVLVVLIVLAVLAGVGASLGGAELFEWAMAFAWLGLGAAVPTALLSLKRSPQSTLLGLSFDRVAALHRWLGAITVLCITLHMGLCFLAGGITEDDEGDTEEGDVNATAPADDSGPKEASVQDVFIELDPIYVFGFFSWLALAVLTLTALPPVRRLAYEVFKYPHLVLVLAFFILGILHQDGVLPFAICVLAPVALDKAVQFYFSRTRHTAAVDYCASGIVKVSFPRCTVSSAVGQYVLVNFPAVSYVQWHPFSLTSSPLATNDQISIRAAGGFTRAVADVAQAAERDHVPLYVRVDGPFGGFSFNMEQHPVAVLIAGGVGVTPMINVLRSVYNLVNEPKYTDQDPGVDVVARQHIYLVWCITQEDHYNWFEDILSAAQRASSLGDVPALHLEVHVTRKTTCQAPLRSGRPDVARRVDEIVSKHGKPTSVFACGPAAMVDAAWDASTRLLRSGHEVSFHRESYQF
eukprot:m.214109 g.214109  ORF g.214109 m.214109 type:complete len:537 (-) comp10143_c5_seq6:372-1982(-)